jgi:hypothetical protein
VVPRRGRGLPRDAVRLLFAEAVMLRNLHDDPDTATVQEMWPIVANCAR